MMSRKSKDCDGELVYLEVAESEYAVVTRYEVKET